MEQKILPEPPRGKQYFITESYSFAIYVKYINSITNKNNAF